MMKKTRKLTTLLLALVLLLATALPALAIVPDRPANLYVLDSAGVLSDATEQEIVQKNTKLFEETGAEIVIVAVDFLGGEDIADYAYDLFNAWNIGSSQRNNGLLLVLAIGEDDYFAQSGYGIDDYFDGEMLDDLLWNNLEDDFADGNYDAGVLKFFRAALAEMESYYRTHSDGYTSAGGTEPVYGSASASSGHASVNFLGRIISMLVKIIIVVVIFAVIVIVLRAMRNGGGGGGYTSGYRSPSNSFWTGMWVGRSITRRRNRWGNPPPPPPPPPGGFGGFGGPRPGGSNRRPPSSGFRRPTGGSSFGGSNRPSRPSGGGFSSGRSSGGSRSSGGGFSRGGGSRGGGAGRR